MYTVGYFYEKVLDALDKNGSDFFSIDYVMSRLETSCYDFIGESVKFIENTQEIRDDLLPLYNPYEIVPVAHPVYPNEWLVALSDDYLHLMSLIVTDQNVKVRESKLIRHGQLEIQLNDPDTVPTAEYPIVVMYDSYIKILSPGQPTLAKGFYIKKPTFGAHDETADIDVEIAVNLPEQSLEKIIKMLVRDIHISMADPRAQAQSVSENSYRKRSK